MGLTQKILIFTSLLVVVLVGTTLGFTTLQADRLARTEIEQALTDTHGVWEAFQADRYEKLKLGVRALANDPYFKPLVESEDIASVADTLTERGQDIKADFFVATNRDGLLIARSDRPGASGDDLSQDPVVMEPLEGREFATVWLQGGKPFHTVSIPMVTAGELKGVLIAGYAINEALAGDIRKLTHSEIAFLTHLQTTPELAVSSLGTREAAFKESLGRPELAAAAAPAPFSLELGGEPFVGVRVPLKTTRSAASPAGDKVVGSLVALRSLSVEMAAFRQYRNSLVVVALIVMALGLGAAFVMASRITNPVKLLVSLVQRARDGSYSGAVSVATSDEIGVLARAFNSLLADLREKEQLIGFLRDGMTAMKRAPAAAGATTNLELGTATTAALSAVGPQIQALSLAPGAVFSGRYEIHETIGKGGMGVVYRARDRQLDEEVALKLLRPDVIQDDPTHLERFKQEIKLARRITHKNVLRTHDFGDADGTPYISMEFLEGVTLKDLVRSKGALPLGVGMRIAKQMCLGLEAAHEQGVVHRDIKPQNMLILPESGELKIMDFGIARVSSVKQQGSDSGLTTAGTVMGTPDYMPPEQAQGQPADFRSDVYSLGVVLFEIFTGGLPFRGDTPMAVVLNHIQAPPPRPRELNPRLPAALEAIILRCLDKSPTRRYQKVEELLADLTDVSSQLESAA
ncbi:MAG: protein kinase [Vicinamibacteria bacterium]|nr:protein kinase [Vicinamibacteria bacterium]